MKSLIDRIGIAMFYPISFIGIMWVVQILNAELFNYSLNTYGIIPRTFEGFSGLFFAPFLHGSYTHIIGNSIMFLVLSFLICLYSPVTWLKSMVFGAILGGLFTWVLGSYAAHVGASGVIFALYGTVFGMAIYQRNFFFILLAIFLGVVFGTSMIIGLIPQHGISFAGHLGGLLAGVVATGYGKLVS